MFDIFIVFWLFGNISRILITESLVLPAYMIIQIDSGIKHFLTLITIVHKMRGEMFTFNMISCIGHCRMVVTIADRAMISSIWHSCQKLIQFLGVWECLTWKLVDNKKQKCTCSVYYLCFALWLYRLFLFVNDSEQILQT